MTADQLDIIRLLEAESPEALSRHKLSERTGTVGVLVDDTLRDLRDLGLVSEVQDVAEYGRQHRVREPGDVLWILNSGSGSSR